MPTTRVLPEGTDKMPKGIGDPGSIPGESELGKEAEGTRLDLGQTLVFNSRFRSARPLRRGKRVKPYNPREIQEMLKNLEDLELPQADDDETGN